MGRGVEPPYTDGIEPRRFPGLIPCVLYRWAPAIPTDYSVGAACFWLRLPPRVGSRHESAENVAGEGGNRLVACRAGPLPRREGRPPGAILPDCTPAPRKRYGFSGCRTSERLTSCGRIRIFYTGAGTGITAGAERRGPRVGCVEGGSATIRHDPRRPGVGARNRRR